MNPLNIYLPIAGIQFSALLLVLIGFCVGVLGGFFGVGGGWMVTPALNIFGFDMAFAIGTPLANIFGQSIGAVKKHHRMRNIDWKLGLVSIASSVVGVEIGSRVILALEKNGQVGTIVRSGYIFLLTLLGVYMMYDTLASRPARVKSAGDVSGSGKCRADDPDAAPGNRPLASKKLHNVKIPPMISFPVSGIEGVSLWIILSIFLVTGFLSGFMGVGGGFLILPVLVYLIGLPTTIAVGTSLVTVLFTAAYGCFTYAMKGRVELVAAFIMLIGAAIGSQIGATAVRYIRGYGIRLLFAIMIICAAFSVVAEQVHRATDRPEFGTLAGFILMGTAISMVSVIIIRLVWESRRERKWRLGNSN